MVLKKNHKGFPLQSGLGLLAFIQLQEQLLTLGSQMIQILKKTFYCKFRNSSRLGFFVKKRFKKGYQKFAEVEIVVTFAPAIKATFIGFTGSEELRNKLKKDLRKWDKGFIFAVRKTGKFLWFFGKGN